MSNRLTYGKLFDYLKSLGYVQRSIYWNDREQWVFHHDSFENASIFLSQRPLYQAVDPMHLGSVRATLKAHGLIDENAESVV